MQNLRGGIPSSVRRTSEDSAFVQSLRTRSVRQVMGVIPDGQVGTVAKSQFARLAHEAEDARLTGVTRSLERRLLALNLNDSKEDCETLL